MKVRARLIPPVIVAVVIAGFAIGVPAGAAPSLPDKSPTQLLALAMTSPVKSLTGNVTTTFNLGLPSLPSSLSGSSRDANALPAILSGTHTVRVWIDGPNQQRWQVLEPLDETDVVHNGSNVWTYVYSRNSATHVILPAAASHLGALASAGAQANAWGSPIVMPVPATDPTTMAQQLLSAIDATTQVTAGSSVQVAGRSAYTLNVQPRTTESLVGEISLAIDAKTGMVLKVAVTARGASSPAIEVAFSSLSLSTPSASTFTFTPPPGATVSTHDLSALGAPGSGGGAGGPGTGPRVVGHGWTSVLVTPAVGMSPTLGELLAKAGTPVAGGTLVHTALVNLLVTGDGRFAIGAVTASVLEQAVRSSTTGTMSSATPSATTSGRFAYAALPQH